MLGINVKLIICIKLVKSVYSGKIISTINGATKAPNMAKITEIITPKIFAFFVCTPEESSANVNLKIVPGTIARNESIWIVKK